MFLAVGWQGLSESWKERSVKLWLLLCTLSLYFKYNNRCVFWSLYIVVASCHQVIRILGLNLKSDKHSVNKTPDTNHSIQLTYVLTNSEHESYIIKFTYFANHDFLSFWLTVYLTLWTCWRADYSINQLANSSRRWTETLCDHLLICKAIWSNLSLF